ncbi:MAG: hypothetical protein COZ07_05880 [Candidatus Infernicultor aquiphilus]|uniref:Uncharacterized protein n=1 Tax=Candidatus Infernicultor aquiphilus TaxID=1805029 RepID=A0A2M7PP31_9BACT|nr:MAG: hypothetical protein COZ07_05880 [Candidatus Atribacteria bacterium CG_4_10_14_3_um_filter_34_13]
MGIILGLAAMLATLVEVLKRVEYAPVNNPQRWVFSIACVLVIGYTLISGQLVLQNALIIATVIGSITVSATGIYEWIIKKFWI